MLFSGYRGGEEDKGGYVRNEKGTGRRAGRGN